MKTNKSLGLKLRYHVYFNLALLNKIQPCTVEPQFIAAGHMEYDRQCQIPCAIPDFLYVIMRNLMPFQSRFLHEGWCFYCGFVHMHPFGL